VLDQGVPIDARNQRVETCCTSLRVDAQRAAPLLLAKVVVNRRAE
jgi:hypothetical protein